MNIVVNTQLLQYGKLDGIGWFTYETLTRITRNHPEHNFILVFDRKPSKILSFPDNTQMVVLYPQSRHPFLWLLRFEILMPLLLRRYKADVFLSPDGWMTTFTSVPCVQVIHDLNFVHIPADIPFWTRLYYNFFFPRHARKAKRIATVSEYSRQDIIKTYRIPEAKIDVMHNGCNERYKPVVPSMYHSIRRKYSSGRPYFIFVGALIPRKNIARIFLAFNMFKKTDEQNTQLLIVGDKKWWTPQINEAWNKIECRNDIIFLGRRGVDELNQLYGGSLALVFPALFEGFGIPILEAFHSETAVITSNVSSMPEVAGDASLLVNPLDVDEITDAMQQISTSPELRKRLIERGRERRRLFSWDITAQKLWQSVESVLEEQYPEKFDKEKLSLQE